MNHATQTRLGCETLEARDCPAVFAMDSPDLRSTPPAFTVDSPDLRALAADTRVPVASSPLSTPALSAKGIIINF